MPLGTTAVQVLEIDSAHGQELFGRDAAPCETNGATCSCILSSYRIAF